jgi:hypothetical protein
LQASGYYDKNKVVPLDSCGVDNAIGLIELAINDVSGNTLSAKVFVDIIVKAPKFWAFHSKSPVAT